MANQNIGVATGLGAIAQVRVLDMGNGGALLAQDAGAGLISAGTDQRLTVDGTVGGVQLSTLPDGTTHVLLTTETAEIRYTLDGSAPTSTNGHVLAAGEERVWNATMAAAAKFIRTTGVSATIHASPLKGV